jgi:hypothetical protein
MLILTKDILYKKPACHIMVYNDIEPTKREYISFDLKKNWSWLLFGEELLESLTDERFKGLKHDNGSCQFYFDILTIDKRERKKGFFARFINDYHLWYLNNTYSKYIISFDIGSQTVLFDIKEISAYIPPVYKITSVNRNILVDPGTILYSSPEYKPFK